VDADGTNAHRLTNDDRSDTAVAWSPTGRRLAYISQPSDEGHWQVRVMEANGRDSHAIFTCEAPCGHAGTTLAWSPDGR
jgi:Tol biopolymer transport system component